LPFWVKPEHNFMSKTDLLKTSYRFYRNWCQAKHLTSFSVIVKETDLWIKAQSVLSKEAKEAVFKYRAQLEKYIEFHPIFKNSLSPLPYDPFAPKIVKQMLKAAQKTGVGPMASVAGALAQAVGEELLKHTEEVIVENGGDIYLKVNSSVDVGIFAANSPLSGRIGIKVFPHSTPLAICTSSGKVGHSFSQGQADAVTVITKDAAMADAAATAIGNLVKSKSDIPEAIRFGQKLEGIEGLIVILDKHLAVWGQVELIAI